MRLKLLNSWYFNSYLIRENLFDSAFDLGVSLGCTLMSPFWFSHLRDDNRVVISFCHPCDSRVIDPSDTLFELFFWTVRTDWRYFVLKRLEVLSLLFQGFVDQTEPFYALYKHLWPWLGLSPLFASL